MKINDLQDQEREFHAQFKAMKKEKGLTNADVAAIVGLTTDSVKTMTQPNKPFPAWGKGLVWGWLHGRKD